jgi:hypothetical protein
VVEEDRPVKALVAGLALLLSTCTTPNDAVEDPLPRPQQPAPNADPAPTGGREVTIVFTVSQGSYTPMIVAYSFEGPGVSLKPPPQNVGTPEWRYELTVSSRGIAKITADSAEGGTGTINCNIGIKGGELLNESQGFNSCETFAPISF